MRSFGACSASRRPTTVSNPQLIRFTAPFDLSGFPALSVPCGFGSGGLPIGLQIAGRPWAEATVLRVAHAYQQITDWHTRRPPRARRPGE